VGFRADNATDADISRWVALFENGGVKVKVSK